jgi:hypothetical protein
MCKVTRSIALVVLVFAALAVMSTPASAQLPGIQCPPGTVGNGVVCNPPLPCACNDTDDWDEIPLGETTGVVVVDGELCLYLWEVFLIQCPYDLDQFFIEYDPIEPIYCVPYFGCDPLPPFPC